jgi:hypothetical protein
MIDTFALLSPPPFFLSLNSSHGGGRRCSAENCNKLAVPCGKFSKFCVRHGGGRRCATYGCHKSAQSGTSHCVRCGGGRRCQFLGCTKVARGKTDYCMAHTKLFSSRFWIENFWKFRILRFLFRIESISCTEIQHYSAENHGRSNFIFKSTKL